MVVAMFARSVSLTLSTPLIGIQSVQLCKNGRKEEKEKTWLVFECPFFKTLFCVLKMNES
jgi:hypothetical protein